MNKSKSRNVWKIEIREKMEASAIETALSEASKKMMKKVSLEGADAVLDRIDIKKNKTMVFITGNIRTANEFSRTLRAAMPKTKIISSGVKPADIKKMMKQL